MTLNRQYVYPLAIVIPFTSWESETLLQNIEYWNTYSPCISETPVKIDLVFYFHKDFTKGSGHLVRMFRERIYKFENVSKCFNAIKFLNAGLLDSQDLYPESAARMFFKLFKTNWMQNYKYFFYMEADVLPCKKGWIDALINESKIPGGFWVRGSIIRGSDDIESSYLNHINGNSLYSVSNTDFKSFISNIIEPNFWKNTKNYMGGYDVALFMIRLDRSIISWNYFT